MKMSPHEGDGDIEQERRAKVNGVEPGGDRQDRRQEVAEALGLSLRLARRILPAYWKEDAVALGHGNRGAKLHNALGASVTRQMLEQG